MKTLQDYVTVYGPEAGPKLYKTLRSRAAYKGVSTRRRHQIELLTGRPFRLRRKASVAVGQARLPLTDPAETPAVIAASSGDDQGESLNFQTVLSPRTTETLPPGAPSTSTS